MHRFRAQETAKNNERIKELKMKFRECLEDQSKGHGCNYYDFLLVAKLLNFRF